MHFEVKSCHRNVTDHQLLMDLAVTAGKLKKNTITMSEYKAYGRYAATTLTNRFRTWNIAIEKAGLAINRRYNISVANLFDNLLKVWMGLGRQPLMADLVPPLSRFGHKPYVRAFGTWGKALHAFAAFANNEVRVPEGGELAGALGASSLGHTTKRYIKLGLRHSVLKRDHYRCRACGAAPANDPGVVLHVDHIRPWSKGGETVIDNLQTLCSLCNLGKNDS